MAVFSGWQLVEMVRTRLNYEGSDQFVTDDEVLGYLNDEIEELWHLVTAINSEFLGVRVYGTEDGTGTAGPLISKDGELDMSEVADSGRTYAYAVWRHLRFEVISGGQRYRLERVEWNERERYGWASSQTGRPRYYTLFNNKLCVLPRPDRDYAYEWDFIPVVQRLSVEGIPASANFYMGWQNFVVNGACATIAAKEERDPSYWLMQKERWRDNITTQVSHRDEGQPARAVDQRKPDDGGFGDYLGL